MSTQTLFGNNFPTPCKRCGGALYRQLDYCPYCGAVHPLDAGPRERTAIPDSRAGIAGKVARSNAFDITSQDEADLPARAIFAGEPFRPESTVPGSALISPDASFAPPDELPYVAANSALQIRKVLYGIGAVVLVGLAYVGYELATDRDVSNGNVDQFAGNENSQDARTITGTIAPYVPAQSENQGVVVSKAAVQTTLARSAQIIPATPIAAPVAVAPARPAPHFRDAAQALQTARLAFRANDLSAAEAALGVAQTLQPDNADAQDLAAELQPLAARRDAALQAAQACVSQQSWPCARQHADETLAIDTSNETAKSVLQRVIRETGWAPLDLHAARASVSVSTSQ